MSQIDRLAEQLKRLEQELHECGNPQIRFNQQKIARQNMSFSGANGRIWIQPANGGYDISLSGTALTTELGPVLQSIYGRKCDGHKQTNRKLGRTDQPYWRVPDFSLVKAAVYLYAKTRE